MAGSGYFARQRGSEIQRPHLSNASLVLAATLLLAPLGVRAEIAAQAAATLYAIKYKGCHSPPEVIHCQVPFLLGQFANIESGSMIFILVPDNSGKLLGN